MSFDKELISESFYRIEPNLDNFFRAFFDNVFILDPDMVKLFRHLDLNELRPRLIRALTIAVNNMKNPEYLKIYLQSLGERQTQHDITETCFPVFEEALIQTLMLFHMNSWNPKLESSWRDFFYYAFEHISDGMTDATLRREFEEFIDKKEKVDFYKKAA